VVRGGGEEEIRQRVIAREHGEPVKTLQWWVRKSREAGLCGLARLPRSA
jgi:hypothetical protein